MVEIKSPGVALRQIGARIEANGGFRQASIWSQVEERSVLKGSKNGHF